MNKFDFFDFLIVCGITILTFGISLISAPAAMIVLGILLIGFGLFGASRKAGR